MRYLLLWMMTILLGVCSTLMAAEQVGPATFEVLKQDPGNGELLTTEDPLYFHLGYESSVPLRFQVNGIYHGELREVGAYCNDAALHASGKGEALVWLSYENPTRVDAVRVSVFDATWKRLGSLEFAVNVGWQSGGVVEKRQPAAWVEQVVRQEQRRQDYTFDPKPKPHEARDDAVFLLILVAIPAYLIIQIMMLRRYRGRWNELAAVPLITLVPLILFTLLGFGFDADLWPKLLMYYLVFSFFYLVTLWFIKKIRGEKSVTAGSRRP